MTGLLGEPLRLASVIPRTLQRTTAVLAQTVAGHCYILKLGPDPSRPNALANEAIGAELMLHLGIPTPRWRVVELTKRDIAMIKRYQDLSIAPEPGLHFASEHLDHPDYTLRDEREDRDDADRYSSNHAKFIDIFIFDIWVNRSSLRQWITRICDQRGYASEAYFIDNKDIFAGGIWSASRPDDIEDNPIKPLCRHVGQDLRSRILHFQKIGRRAVVHTLKEVPGQWHQDKVSVLEECLLDRLADLFLLVEAQVCRLIRSNQTVSLYSRERLHDWERLLDNLRTEGHRTSSYPSHVG